MKYLKDRTEIAYAMNFGKYPVVKINMEESKDGYDNMYVGDLVKVMTPTATHPDLYATGQLYCTNGKYEVMTDAVVLEAGFGYCSVMENLSIAQAPVFKAGETVIVVEDYPISKRCKVRVMRVSQKVNPHVYPCATLEDVEDDFNSKVQWNG